MTGIPITNQDKINVVNYYTSTPMTISNCANHFSFSNPTIIKILNEYNVPRYKKAKVYNPNLQEDFFRYIDPIQGEFPAYFLGLIITDGNIFKTSDGNRQHSISITLQEEDEYLLYAFLAAVNSNTIVGHDGRGSATAAVRSDIMAQDLAQYGVYPNKTLYTRLPVFNKQHIMGWLIRGILDGDGSIGYGVTSGKRFYHHISFCGTKLLMEDIRDYLHNTLGLSYPKVYTYKNRHLSEVKYQNLHDIQLLGDWMYFHVPMNICMNRKYNKYLDLKRQFGLF